MSRNVIDAFARLLTWCCGPGVGVVLVSERISSYCSCVVMLRCAFFASECQERPCNFFSKAHTRLSFHMCLISALNSQSHRFYVRCYGSRCFCVVFCCLRCRRVWARLVSAAGGGRFSWSGLGWNWARVGTKVSDGITLFVNNTPVHRNMKCGVGLLHFCHIL